MQKHKQVSLDSTFKSIVKQTIFAYVNEARICSWNQLVLSND